MEMLIIERQNYYKEFFEKGLHSNLVSINSQFNTSEGVTFSKTGDSNKVNVIEKVTMVGNPIVTSPDDYPLIQAAKWAIKQTNNADVKNHLYQYLKSMTRGVQKSADEGVTIVFLINHDIAIGVEKGQAKIIGDTFSDKSTDNGEGFDNVSWTDNKYTRITPEWEKMLDYQIYNVPIETLGEYLLKDNEAVIKIGTTELDYLNNSSNINRENAVWYIQHYTSNPGLMYLCQSGALVYRFTAYYNASFTYIWNHPSLECFDCTDYVSQALYYGGFPSDNTWKPELSNLAWTRVSNLGTYFSDTEKKRGYWANSLVNLTPGDVVFIYDTNFADPWRHVVMYSSVNPSGYSAHTNDRLNYSFSPVLNRFLAINYYESVFLPLILNDPLNNSVKQGLSQNPYPSPVEFQKSPPEFSPYPAP
jgi:hypothetical protein